MEPVSAADCRLLLSLLKFAIVPPDQRERIEAWLEAKRDGVAPLTSPNPGHNSAYRTAVHDVYPR